MDGPVPVPSGSGRPSVRVASVPSFSSAQRWMVARRLNVNRGQTYFHNVQYPSFISLHVIHRYAYVKTENGRARTVLTLRFFLFLVESSVYRVNQERRTRTGRREKC